MNRNLFGGRGLQKADIQNANRNNFTAMLIAMENLQVWKMTFL